ncbi:transposase [Nonomuraea sp. NPDC050383]|uniref:transposase n=1 Tax=Nonomuraea sp. NPDC050383 TaxID=3364362 RepID=UPI0037AC1DCA
MAAISREHLRRILRKGGVTWQTTTTWKASNDPLFIAKMQRVLELYDHPPAGGRVICVDEFGPLNLMPRKGKRWREFLSFLKTLRRRWPGERLYVIMDNYSPHKHSQVRAWAADHDVELVFLPTYGSWLNWIESEFAALRYYALNGTDHRTHEEQNAAIGGYVRWHNARAQPKTSFAASSPIRSWTSYLVNVA